MQKTVKKITLFELKEVREVLLALLVVIAAVCATYPIARAQHQTKLEEESRQLEQESIEESSRLAKWESEWAAREAAESIARSEAESMAAAGIRMSPFVGSTNDAGQKILKMSYPSGQSDRRTITVDEYCEADYTLVTDNTQYEAYNSYMNFCYPIFLYNQVTQDYKTKVMDTYEAAKFSNGEDNQLIMEFTTTSNLDYQQILKDMFKRVKSTYGFEAEITVQEMQEKGGYLYWEYKSDTVVAKGAIKTRLGVCVLATVICPAPTDSEDAKYKDYYMEMMTHLATLGDTTGTTLTWEAYNEQQK
ncbi:MAG: hypothetical protein IJZ85_03210 [Lachnospiraceae bacterium]|nr:hypothetical protein [Lachnospiraceae bacterium]